MTLAASARDGANFTDAAYKVVSGGRRRSRVTGK